jgi:hypothetical protein
VVEAMLTTRYLKAKYILLDDLTPDPLRYLNQPNK